MTDRTKSFLIIFITLFIGFIAGFLTSSSLSRYRLSDLRGSMRAQEKFEVTIAKSLQLDEAQIEAIHPVISKHFPEIRQMQRDFGATMRTKMDSLKSDLKPHLRSEQIEMMRGRPPFGPPSGRKNKKHRRPPPPQP